MRWNTVMGLTMNYLSRLIANADKYSEQTRGYFRIYCQALGNSLNHTVTLSNTHFVRLLCFPPQRYAASRKTLAGSQPLKRTLRGGI